MLSIGQAKGVMFRYYVKREKLDSIVQKKKKTF